MLVNVRSDRQFQRFLSQQEQILHIAMVPVIAQGIRLVIARGGHNANEVMVKRGEKVLAAHTKRIFREVYGSVNRARLTKQEGDDNEDITDFMNSQLDYINREAASSITKISDSLVNDLRDIFWRGVQEGQSNDQIARTITGDIPDRSRNRAATIARTETHGSAMWAMDETLNFKEIEIQKKQWWSASDSRVRPSHAALHGLIVDKNQPFETDDGDQLMFPGDDSLGASAGTLVNCRCACLYFTEGSIPAEESATSDEFG